MLKRVFNAALFTLIFGTAVCCIMWIMTPNDVTFGRMLLGTIVTSIFEIIRTYWK